jgi:hypothetical protein
LFAGEPAAEFSAGMTWPSFLPPGWTVEWDSANPDQSGN